MYHRQFSRDGVLQERIPSAAPSCSPSWRGKLARPGAKSRCDISESLSILLHRDTLDATPHLLPSHHRALLKIDSCIEPTFACDDTGINFQRRLLLVIYHRPGDTEQPFNGRRRWLHCHYLSSEAEPASSLFITLAETLSVAGWPA